MLEASIDLGTNTCLLLIRDGDRVLHDESSVVRLGQEVDQTGELHPDAMKRAAECLDRYAETARKLGVDPAKIFAVGTAQARDARNARAFFDQVRIKTGISFTILSGDEEARATFVGAALPGMSPAQMVVMDIGGGSTEIVSERGGTSLQVGAVRMTERFLKSNPVTDDEFWACEKAIDAQLATLIPWREQLGIARPELVTVAGTAVTLAMVQASMTAYDRERIDGSMITRGDAHRLVEEFKWRTTEERATMTGMEPKRADVILAGALIYWRAMEVLDFARATVSTRGLRYGVLKLR
jgi:exopolyphosphatase/guanosine-5'-triphosphate,3'-diphosphate pyrophosphatase